MSLIYPGNIGELMVNGAGAVSFVLYKRPNSQTSTFFENVILYMPLTLENPTNVSWEQFNRGITKPFADMVTDYNSTIEKAAKLDVAEVVKGAVLRVAEGSQVVEHGARAISNPFIAMTFKGLGFREFEMAFKFTPHNEGESDTIKEIIKTFRKAALPECRSGLLTFPMEMDIQYIGNAYHWLNRFKKSVLTDVHVNYTSAGHYAAMKNGFPAETELRIRFTENELVCRSDIDEGY